MRLWGFPVWMWLLAALAASCSSGGHAASRSPDGGGFNGKKATLYAYAYTHCLQLGTTSARSQPSGSDPPIFSLRNAYPLSMIGPIKPHGSSEWEAAKDGCALAIVRAFAASHSSLTAAVCTQMAPWLPAKVPECP